MRKHPKEQRLDALEADFRPLLLSCLEECARGRYGLFGQNDAPEIKRYFEWPEADSLKAIALEIRRLRSEFGQPNPLSEKFLHYCSLRSSNDPGEPKLARKLLDEVKSE
jgi:hypothetical protein